MNLKTRLEKVERKINVKPETAFCECAKHRVEELSRLVYDGIETARNISTLEFSDDYRCNRCGLYLSEPEKAWLENANLIYGE